MNPSRASDGVAVLLATRNVGKLRELQPILAEWGVEPRLLEASGFPELPEEAALECFETFAENALAKARHFHRLAGGLVLAEDSGLCVDALAGAPGVHSKRWNAADRREGESVDAGNIRRLLRELREERNRTAHFACSAALVWDGGALVAHGITPGRILEAPDGEGGFGYDPVFWSDDLGAVFARVSREEKSRVSHRQRAVRALWAAYREATGQAGVQASASKSNAPR